MLCPPPLWYKYWKSIGEKVAASIFLSHYRSRTIHYRSRAINHRFLHPITDPKLSICWYLSYCRSRTIHLQILIPLQIQNYPFADSYPITDPELSICRFLSHYRSRTIHLQILIPLQTQNYPLVDSYPITDPDLSVCRFLSHYRSRTIHLQILILLQIQNYPIIDPELSIFTAKITKRNNSFVDWDQLHVNAFSKRYKLPFQSMISVPDPPWAFVLLLGVYTDINPSKNTFMYYIDYQICLYWYIVGGG